MDLDLLSVSPELRTRLRALCHEYGHNLAGAEKLVGDASTRVFLRLFFNSDESSIAMCYPDSSISEDILFMEVHGYLQGLGLPVPEIRKHFKNLGILILEDLGDLLLENIVQNADESTIRLWYSKAVELAISMIRTSDASPKRCVAHSLAFDFKKLSFEMNFFIEHFVNGFLKSSLKHSVESELRTNLYSVCEILAEEQRFFAHRDYHSRNLMINDERLVMIDFQDARMGPAQYDLASMLRDSYVFLDDELIDFLIDEFYQATHDILRQSPERFRSVFDLMSFQRNIKALGTFGYQTNVIGTGRYVSSISRTTSYIQRNLSRNPHLVANPDIIMNLVVYPSKMLLADS